MTNYIFMTGHKDPLSIPAGRRYFNVNYLINRDAMARYKVACRAIGIINRMKPGACKSKHQSRTFRNLNKLRLAAKVVL